jgi:hypothetical protein
MSSIQTNFNLNTYFDPAQESWIKGYATTVDAQREGYPSRIADLIVRQDGPINTSEFQQAAIGEHWWYWKDTISAISQTGYEIFCICQDHHRLRGVPRPRCDEFILVAAADRTVQLFGIPQSSRELDSILHTLLLRDIDIDPSVGGDNVTADFAQINPRVAGVAVWGYYLLRIHFDRTTCPSIIDWILLLVRRVNNNFDEAAYLGSQLHQWDQDKEEYPPFKRRFNHGELPTSHWEPLEWSLNIEEIKPFCHIEAPEEENDIGFDETLPRQRSGIRYPRGRYGEFYTTA